MDSFINFLGKELPSKEKKEMKTNSHKSVFIDHEIKHDLLFMISEKHTIDTIGTNSYGKEVINPEMKHIPFKINENDNNSNNVFKISNSDSTFYETNDIPEERVREYYWKKYGSYFYKGNHVNERFINECLSFIFKICNNNILNIFNSY
jgi:hypothetical protein